MHDYTLNKKLNAVFQDNSWWTFMGKYFGFPDCCIQKFCAKENSDPSPFDGTGYVPCACCNQTLTSPSAIEQNIQQKSPKKTKKIAI